MTASTSRKVARTDQNRFDPAPIRKDMSLLPKDVLAKVFECLSIRENFIDRRLCRSFLTAVNTRLERTRELHLGDDFGTKRLHGIFSTELDLFLRLQTLSVTFVSERRKDKEAYHTHERSIAKACKRYPTITDLTIHDRRFKQPLMFEKGWGANLTHLKLVGCPLPSARRMIGECPQLREVSLMQCISEFQMGTFPGDQVQQALAISQLSELEVHNPADDGIGLIAHHCQQTKSKLASLILTFSFGTGDKITNVSMQHLRICTRLKSLELKFCAASPFFIALSPDTAKQLQSALPTTSLYIALDAQGRSREPISAYLERFK